MLFDNQKTTKDGMWWAYEQHICPCCDQCYIGRQFQVDVSGKTAYICISCGDKLTQKYLKSNKKKSR